MGGGGASIKKGGRGGEGGGGGPCDAFFRMKILTTVKSTKQPERNEPPRRKIAAMAPTMNLLFCLIVASRLCLTMSSEAATVDVVLVEDVHTIPAQVDDLVSTMRSEAAKVDVLVEGVHARPPQVDDLFSKVHENCNGFIATIIAEAEKEKVAMTAEAQQSAANIVAEAEEKTKEMKIELENWDAEQKRIASTHNFEPTVKLDVGGHSFTTTLITLTRFPDTMLGAMFSGRHALSKDEAGAHFIDRDGTHFREIVNFLRIPDSWDNSGIQGRQLRELTNEAEYYGLKDLMFPKLPGAGNQVRPNNQTDSKALVEDLDV